MSDSRLLADYLEGKISFRIWSKYSPADGAVRPRSVAANAVSPLRTGEAAEVLRMSVENACEHDMLVQILARAGRSPFLSRNSTPKFG